MIGAIVDGGALLKVVWASLAAGIGLTAAYALAILGATRALEANRDGRVGGTALFALLAITATLAVAGAVVLGFIVVGEG